MKITKFGHCCLLIEYKGKRIVTDPGGWSTIPADLSDIDLILITHEHGDHLHVESLQGILKNNPGAKIITNTGVGKILSEKAIEFSKLEEGGYELFDDIKLEAFGDVHREVYKELGKVQNTGYFIDEKLFYPGDALTVINRPVAILAAPVAGPWLKFKEAIDYILEVKPKAFFPVHENVVIPEFRTALFERLIPNAVKDQPDIKYVALSEGTSAEFE